jgi:hypothetical protein
MTKIKIIRFTVRLSKIRKKFHTKSVERTKVIEKKIRRTQLMGHRMPSFEIYLIQFFR